MNLGLERANRKTGRTKLPWYEEVLRSLSISFLSMMLSSTAKTWNCDSAAAMPIGTNVRSEQDEIQEEEEEDVKERRKWFIFACGGCLVEWFFCVLIVEGGRRRGEALYWGEKKKQDPPKSTPHTKQDLTRFHPKSSNLIFNYKTSNAKSNKKRKKKKERKIWVTCGSKFQGANFFKEKVRWRSGGVDHDFIYCEILATKEQGRKEKKKLEKNWEKMKFGRTWKLGGVWELFSFIGFGGKQGPKGDHGGRWGGPTQNPPKRYRWCHQLVPLFSFIYLFILLFYFIFLSKGVGRKIEIMWSLEYLWGQVGAVCKERAISLDSLVRFASHGHTFSSFYFTYIHTYLFNSASTHNIFGRSLTCLVWLDLMDF